MVVADVFVVVVAVVVVIVCYCLTSGIIPGSVGFHFASLYIRVYKRLLRPRVS